MLPEAHPPVQELPAVSGNLEVSSFRTSKVCCTWCQNIPRLRTLSQVPEVCPLDFLIIHPQSWRVVALFANSRD